jgi:hypothetical protein
MAILAKLVPRGHVVGLDLWREEDQSGNNLEVTRRNLIVEGVAERCELKTDDILAMPFEDNTFDLCGEQPGDSQRRRARTAQPHSPHASPLRGRARAETRRPISNYRLAVDAPLRATLAPTGNAQRRAALIGLAFVVRAVPRCGPGHRHETTSHLNNHLHQFLLGSGR